MEKYISDDKKTISLPVPLGTELYIVNTTCGDFCLFQKENFNKLLDKTKVRCSNKLPCHTIERSPINVTLTIDNLSILKDWQKRVFLTEKEAKEKTKEIINNNIKILTENGIVVYDGDYGTKRDSL